MAKQKKVLLNLDQDLYDQMATGANSARLSVTEYIRDAIRAKVKGPIAPVEPALSLLDAPPFDPTPTTVQTSDTALLKFWTERCEAYRIMGGSEALAELLQDTGGVKPPALAFQSIGSLAEWLTANVGEPEPA